MTRKDLACVHEPFGDAFYYGPERMSSRFENDQEAREGSGFSSSTYKTIFDRLDQEGKEGKRVFIKDITYYLVPPESKAAHIAPSLAIKKRGIGTEGKPDGNDNTINKAPFPYDTDGEPGNPTVVPRELLEKFHFTFLIRDPHSSIPSYYRCTIPPLDDVTGFYDFYPTEAGYNELRRFIEYMRQTGQVGPDMASAVNASSTESDDSGDSNGSDSSGDATKAQFCVVDADDLLDNPGGIIKAYCKTVGLDYSSDMLNWDNEEDQRKAKEAFEKWRGFHDDAIDSKDLKPRPHKKTAKSEDHWDKEWKEKYGEKGATIIRQTVNDNMADYLYLKQFAIQV